MRVLAYVCVVLQNAAAAASNKPEAAENTLALYDYKQQQVRQSSLTQGRGSCHKHATQGSRRRSAGQRCLFNSIDVRKGSMRSRLRQLALKKECCAGNRRCRCSCCCTHKYAVAAAVGTCQEQHMRQAVFMSVVLGVCAGWHWCATGPRCSPAQGPYHCVHQPHT
jgi:hypothetical protein